LLQDSRIIAAHDRAVNATLRELESLAETRVRRDGTAAGVRSAGKLVAACFRHDTSRELDPQGYVLQHIAPVRRSLGRSFLSWQNHMENG